MPKHKVQSQYYAEDKDIYDLFKGSNLPFARLIKIARDRGIYVSEEESKEAAINYLSELPFAWPELFALMQELDSADREDKLTFLNVETKTNIQELVNIANRLQTERGAIRDEAYTITTTKEGQIKINVIFSEFDPNITRLKQRRQKYISIEGQVKDGEIQIRHHSNKRAGEIVTAILDSLPSSPESPVKKKRISLSGIRSAELRTKFFESMMREMDGFSFKDVKDLRVDTLTPELKVEGEEEEEESGEEENQIEDGDSEEQKPKRPRKRKQEAAFKSVVKRMALTGEGLHDSPQYKNLVKDGFYITRALWVSRESSGQLRDIQFSAEFSDTENAEGFIYDVRWGWEHDANGDRKKEKSLLKIDDRNTFIPLMEKTAVKALEKVQKEAETSPQASIE
jgi:hypothetical protein